MADFLHFDIASIDVPNGVHNWTSDTFKAAFTNTLPVAATDQTFSDITEIAAGGGYAVGGLTLDGKSLSRTAEITSFLVDDEAFTASGADVGPFQWVVVYNDTSTNKELLGYIDIGSPVTVVDGNTITLNFNPLTGITQQEV